ncbi:uncharacterized protein MONOS_10265c1 [Monocercomonoides exilis]|uniref:uncharacterized protein n=1 Tax=Monocercomonoides exilis TaxID=2049356 RepID=UPI00355AABFC|nr:hypothetical protein MONOS_10265c2 [Monocercomonoides exilis]KAH7819942.1 hypothetical protein MONOS_10265c1 [Monocercomonoides exilis]|eukprot:MONOS_10265.1-p1 / transcript=MONOS_10265.1 / gene=MONOS_10265 / organism=Monocercomonoides_exilis_PA203 / gene_product=unspecified product / transcript_product=unspecified product / location=Mono_scaffold00459:31114-31759(+) / protein_length=152 / sequence_SO=supercontig / SO=protein_coding / is_pseudo=false
MDFALVTQKALQFSLQSVSPFWRRRNKEKKAAGDDKSSSSLPSSSAPAVVPSDASSVEASYMSAAATNEIERWLRIVVKKAAELRKLHERAVSAQCVMLSIPLLALLPFLEDLPRKNSSKKQLLTAVDVVAFLPICNPPDPSLASLAIEWL